MSISRYIVVGVVKDSRACSRLPVRARTASRARGGSGRRAGACRVQQQASALSDQDAHLAVLLVQIDANMVHGWPPSPCATDRVISLWGTLCHHVESGVSRFIPSMRPAAVQLVVMGRGSKACRATSGVRL